MSIIKYLEDNGVEKINQFFENYNFEYTVDYHKEIKVDNTGNVVDARNEGLILFKRKGINVPIPYSIESLGNTNVFCIPFYKFIVNFNTKT